MRNIWNILELNSIYKLCIYIKPNIQFFFITIQSFSFILIFGKLFKNFKARLYITLWIYSNVREMSSPTQRILKMTSHKLDWHVSSYYQIHCDLCRCNLSRQNKWTSSKLLVENKSEKYVLQFQSIYIVHVYYYSIRVSNLTL